MIEAGGDQHYSGDAMHDAAEVFAHAKHLSKPGIRELQREAGDDENDEAGEQDEMLPALVGGHALHHGILHVAARGGLAAPDDEVVHEHGANDAKDEDDVDDPHPARDDGADVFGVDTIGLVYGCQREFLRRSLVALAAGGVEVGAIDGRTWIARRENVVHAMTTGAVRGDHRATFGGEAVVAVHVG